MRIIIGLERLTEPLDEAPADEAGGEMMESLEDVSAAFVPDDETAEAAEPSQGAFETQRCRPKRSELSTPRRAIRGWIERRRSARRQCGKS